MANAAKRVPENAPGDWFVDESCIDCDTCRQVAPETFDDSHRGVSFVARQPDSDAARLRAAMALVACPTSSIGTADKRRVRQGSAAFPEHIVGNVHYCGYASESSFGASSYLVVRPEGNVLIDSPRAARPLLDRISELGGVRTMFLTHRDDVADHAIFRRVFGCERVLHERDLGAGTRDVEHVLRGDDPVPLAADLLAIPVPGHTRGSTALLCGEHVLFSGDHVWGSLARDRLHASRSVCWYSWAEQTRSMNRLRAHRFTWVLPGHGRRFCAASTDAMRGELERLVGSMAARR